MKFGRRQPPGVLSSNANDRNAWRAQGTPFASGSGLRSGAAATAAPPDSFKNRKVDELQARGGQSTNSCAPPSPQSALPQSGVPRKQSPRCCEADLASGKIFLSLPFNDGWSRLSGVAPTPTLCAPRRNPARRLRGAPRWTSC